MIYECFARFRKPSFGSPCNLSRQRGGWGQVRTLCDEPRERRRLQSTRPCPGKPPVIVPEATMCSFSRNVSSSSLLFLHRLFLTRSMPERIPSRAVVFFFPSSGTIISSVFRPFSRAIYWNRQECFISVSFTKQLSRHVKSVHWCYKNRLQEFVQFSYHPHTHIQGLLFLV